MALTAPLFCRAMAGSFCGCWAIQLGGGVQEDAGPELPVAAPLPAAEAALEEVQIRT